MRDLVSHGRWEEIQLSQLDLVGGGAHMRLEAGAHPSPSGNGKRKRELFQAFGSAPLPRWSLQITERESGGQRLLPGGLEAVRGQAEGLGVGAA